MLNENENNGPDVIKAKAKTAALDEVDTSSKHDKSALDNALLNQVCLGSRLGRQASRTRSLSLDTGFEDLNGQLHIGGWPLDGINELALDQHGIGELRLLLPGLDAQMESNQQQGMLWIAPPFTPYSPALLKENIQSNQLLIAKTNTISDTLWSAEQALLADCFSSVLCWTGNYALDLHQLRRLQLAAKKSHSWFVLMRSSECLQNASPASLRAHLQNNRRGELVVNITKQPFGWGGQQCTLAIQPYYENWQRLPADLLPQHNKYTQNISIPERLHGQISSDKNEASVTLLTPLSALRTVH